MSNQSSVNVQRDSVFMSLMTALCNTAQVLEAQYPVRSMDMRPKDSVDHLISTAFLETASWAPYMKQGNIVKDPMKNAWLLCLMQWLSKGHPTPLNLGLTDLGDKKVQRVNDVGALHYMKAADWQTAGWRTCKRKTSLTSTRHRFTRLHRSSWGNFVSYITATQAKRQRNSPTTWKWRCIISRSGFPCRNSLTTIWCYFNTTNMTWTKQEGDRQI